MKRSAAQQVELLRGLYAFGKPAQRAASRPAYYNEIDLYAAQWLRNLIAAGHLPPGDVDTRSIVDVQPDDLAGYGQCHFFAGIGGWALAARLAGWPDDRPLWTGSCPCQPFSVAGKQAGTRDDRHLWPDFFRLIRACRPDVVMGEQVAAAVGKNWLDGVFADLEGVGYACGAAIVPACAVNAPHRRDRLWFVARSGVLGHSERAGLEGFAGHDGAACGRSIEDRSTAATCRGSFVADRDDTERRPDMAGRDNSDRDQAGRHQGAGDVAERREGGVVAHLHQLGPGEERPERSGKFGGTGGDPGDCAGDVADGHGVASREGCSIDGWRHAGSDAVERAGPRSHVGVWHDAAWIIGHDGKARRVEPSIYPLAHGVPARVGRLRAYGNAIVPEEAAEVMGAYLDAEMVGEERAA